MKDLAWDHGPHIRIRQAAPADVPAIRDLAPLAGEGVELEPPLADAVTAGYAGAALQTGVHDGITALHDRLLASLTGPEDVLRAYLNVALVLVAEHDRDGVVGTLLAYPPIRVVEQFRAIALIQGASPLVGVTGLVKIKAVVVAESARGGRIGPEFLKRCRQVYFGCGYQLLYGQIEPSRQDLEGFYQKQGFAVLGVGESVPLWPIFGFNAHLTAEEGQRLFVREKIV
ncbi:GNAT family N-acetyltransferase [Thermopolyspora sp. NPDC052614]|uniref:GNAT family N-acetyltransferase n=1 Tax=Thermopolyspora sp. NPDC052614 TaxID=3155682 RepID=UPI00342F6AF5